MRETVKRSKRNAVPSRRQRRLGLLTAVTLGLAACSSGSDTAAPTQVERTTTSLRSTTTAADRTTTTEQNESAIADCPDPVAVQEVVGGPVDQTSSGGFHSGTGLSYSYQGCGYDLRSGDGSVGITRVTLDDDGPGSPFERLDQAAREDFADDGFEPLAGVGDEAHRDGRGAAVLHGGQMYFVEVDPRPEPLDTELAAVAAMAKEVAVALLPVDLAVDAAELCAPIEAIAASTLGPVEQTLVVSGVAAVDDVSFATNGCTVALGDGRELRVSVADSTDWDRWVKAKTASSLLATYEGFTIGEFAAFATQDNLIVDEGELPLRVTSKDLGLDPEAEADLRLALAELAMD